MKIEQINALRDHLADSVRAEAEAVAGRQVGYAIIIFEPSDRGDGTFDTAYATNGQAAFVGNMLKSIGQQLNEAAMTHLSKPGASS